MDYKQLGSIFLKVKEKFFSIFLCLIVCYATFQGMITPILLGISDLDFGLHTERISQQ